MPRYNDNAPVGNTCPMIDEVIYAIRSVDWSEYHLNESELENIMESIREANSELRAWGNELTEELEEYKKLELK